MRAAAASFVLAACFLGAEAARNHWSVACKGECSYDLPPSDKASASLKIVIWRVRISDITAVAGWAVLSCNSDVLAQDIRLVCHDASCDHLFEGQGAVDTVIRLPEDCGSSAFARVAKITVKRNQAIPKEVAATILERKGVRKGKGLHTRTVYILSVDTDFKAVDVAKTGPISFNLEGYSYPVEGIDVKAPDARSLKKKRNITQFNTTQSVDLPPVLISERYPLLQEDIVCPGCTASLSASLVADVSATVSLGVKVVGTVIPPEITEFAVFTGLNAKLAGTLDLTASLTGSYDSGKQSLYSVALAGVDFPGIFTLGPTFTIYGEIAAALDVSGVGLSVDLAYNIQDAKIFFPPGSQNSTGVFTPTDKIVSVSVHAISPRGTVSAHLIPEIALKLSAFTFIEASASIDVNAGTKVDLNLNVPAHPIGQPPINFGASGSLFGLSGSTEKTLYSHTWDVYTKCLGVAQRDIPTPKITAPTEFKRGTIACPASAPVLSTLEKIIDEKVSGEQ
ncbi:hypothetical protein C8J57DRAFT_1724658 [Mycena rebaudengoi]|nr:hypothetical protein C8J57DRAFT_1724658 [Mycena rebaudengoi]